MVKSLRNQSTDYLETWYAASGTRSPSQFVQWWVVLDLFYTKFYVCSLCGRMFVPSFTHFHFYLPLHVWHRILVVLESSLGGKRRRHQKWDILTLDWASLDRLDLEITENDWDKKKKNKKKKQQKTTGCECNETLRQRNNKNECAFAYLIMNSWPLCVMLKTDVCSKRECRNVFIQSSGTYRPEQTV